MPLDSEIQPRVEYDATTGIYLDQRKNGELVIELDRAGRRPSLTLNLAQSHDLFHFLSQHFGKPADESTSLPKEFLPPVVASIEPPLTHNNGGPTEANPTRGDGQPREAHKPGPRREGRVLGPISKRGTITPKRTGRRT